MRKIAGWCLIATGALTLTTGCAMSRARRERMLSGGPSGGILGYLTPYSESVQAPSAAPSPPLMAQQSVRSAPTLELRPLPTPISTPTSTPPRKVTGLTPPVSSRQPASVTPPVFASNEKVVLRGVLFPKNGSDLDDLQELILDEAVRSLKAHPNLRIYVKGYSDSRGSAHLNQKLSQERAASVAAYLVSNGVPLRQLIVLGMGATHPVATNATAAGRAKNRRVELEPVME